MANAKDAFNLIFFPFLQKEYFSLVSRQTLIKFAVMLVIILNIVEFTSNIQANLSVNSQINGYENHALIAAIIYNLIYIFSIFIAGFFVRLIIYPSHRKDLILPNYVISISIIGFGFFFFDRAYKANVNQHAIEHVASGNDVSTFCASCQIIPNVIVLALILFVVYFIVAWVYSMRVVSSRSTLRILLAWCAGAAVIIAFRHLANDFLRMFAALS